MLQNILWVKPSGLNVHFQEVWMWAGWNIKSTLMLVLKQGKYCHHPSLSCCSSSSCAGLFPAPRWGWGKEWKWGGVHRGFREPPTAFLLLLLFLRIPHFCLLLMLIQSLKIDFFFFARQHITYFIIFFCTKFAVFSLSLKSPYVVRKSQKWQCVRALMCMNTCTSCTCRWIKYMYILTQCKRFRELIFTWISGHCETIWNIIRLPISLQPQSPEHIIF